METVRSHDFLNKFREKVKISTKEFIFQSLLIPIVESHKLCRFFSEIFPLSHAFPQRNEAAVLIPRSQYLY